MSKAGITVQKRSTKKNAHFFRKSAPRFASSRLRLAIPLRVYSNKYARAAVKILAALAALDVQVSLTSDESMKRLPIGILGSGRGSNCRAILEHIRSGDLAAEARVVIAESLDAPILAIARELSIANAYLPPGQFRGLAHPGCPRLQHVLLPPDRLSGYAQGSRGNCFPFLIREFQLAAVSLTRPRLTILEHRVRQAPPEF